MARMTVKEFNTKQVEVLKDVPSDFHSAFSFYAYEKGHAGGYEDILYVLQDLVDAFLPAINKYRNFLLFGDKG